MMPTVMLTTHCPNACEWCFARPKMDEYRARGIPVIASRLGGIPEALGNSGILVDVDLACNSDVEELAETYKIHIEHLLGDRGVFEAHRKRALDWAEVYREMQERNSQEIYEIYLA